MRVRMLVRTSLNRCRIKEIFLATFLPRAFRFRLFGLSRSFVEFSYAIHTPLLSCSKDEESESLEERFHHEFAKVVTAKRKQKKCRPNSFEKSDSATPK